MRYIVFLNFRKYLDFWGSVVNSIEVFQTYVYKTTVEIASKSVCNFLVTHFENKGLQSVLITTGIFAVGTKFPLTCSYTSINKDLGWHIWFA